MIFNIFIKTVFEIILFVFKSLDLGACKICLEENFSKELENGYSEIVSAILLGKAKRKALMNFHYNV